MFFAGDPVTLPPIPFRTGGSPTPRPGPGVGLLTFPRLLTLPSSIKSFRLSAPHPHSLPVSTIVRLLRDKLSCKSVLA